MANESNPEDRIRALENENRHIRECYSKLNDEVCQILGKALGYPWFKDDLRNFPHSTEADGVCVGEHVAESIAEEAANRIVRNEHLVKRIGQIKLLVNSPP